MPCQHADRKFNRGPWIGRKLQEQTEKYFFFGNLTWIGKGSCWWPLESASGIGYMPKLRHRVVWKQKLETKPFSWLTWFSWPQSSKQCNIAFWNLLGVAAVEELFSGTHGNCLNLLKSRSRNDWWITILSKARQFCHCLKSSWSFWRRRILVWEL